MSFLIISGKNNISSNQKNLQVKNKDVKSSRILDWNLTLYIAYLTVEGNLGERIKQDL